MWPYIDLDLMSVVRGLDRGYKPRSFTILAWRVTDGDNHKCSLVGIITLDQGKCSLCEKALARLILISTHSASTQFADRTI